MKKIKYIFFVKIVNFIKPTVYEENQNHAYKNKNNSP